MDIEEFRRRGKEIVDAIADYHMTLPQRRPWTDVRPGYLSELLPDSAPELPESWDDIRKDFDRAIIPGLPQVTVNPHFHGFFPIGFSFPSALGEMLSEGLGCVQFTWNSAPACSELETLVMDWLGKALNLPRAFLSKDDEGKPQSGAGVIQGTATEALLVAVLAARKRAAFKLREKRRDLSEQQAAGKLIAYASEYVHTAFQKCCMIAGVRCRTLPTDDDFSLRGESLKSAIEEDIQAGLTPFFVCATLGTTGFCSFDNLVEIGPLCQEYDAWLHIDAAYAGSAFICPEFRHYAEGWEFSDSFNFNAHKMLLTSIGCSCMWVKNRKAITEGLNSGETPTYSGPSEEKPDKVIDHPLWQVPLGTKFRSLKLWIVLRYYGISGLQKNIRQTVELARKLQSYITGDERFRIAAKPHLGLVCFQLKGEDELNRKLFARLNELGKLLIGCADVRGKFALRFSVNAAQTAESDLQFAWGVIRDAAEEILKAHEEHSPN
ncbi:aromatic-L-amino-acid decarboxylase-like isoform X1 [Oscarella lobularis]|uniref:aromatic-L-amino-acid decarboxylase-like isoform X1 n=2 Tax=Oscarella lobularis TaxID=121494 RepID=UPI003313E36A